MSPFMVELLGETKMGFDFLLSSGESEVKDVEQDNWAGWRRGERGEGDGWRASTCVSCPSLTEVDGTGFSAELSVGQR